MIQIKQIHKLCMTGDILSSHVSNKVVYKKYITLSSNVIIIKNIKLEFQKNYTQ